MAKAKQTVTKRTTVTRRGGNCRGGIRGRRTSVTRKK